MVGNIKAIILFTQAFQGTRRFLLHERRTQAVSELRHTVYDGAQLWSEP